MQIIITHHDGAKQIINNNLQSMNIDSAKAIAHDINNQYVSVEVVAEGSKKPVIGFNSTEKKERSKNAIDNRQKAIAA